MASLCRDCFAHSPSNANSAACPVCGSPRLISHDELFSLKVAHLDCDAFYASVEKRDAPALRLSPLIVGGGRRGVVAAACYMARQYGVRSAMPMFKARAACPHAAVVKPNMAKYKAVGSEVRQLMRAATPAIEPISIDEAFLDFTVTEIADDEPPAIKLVKLAKAVEQQLDVTVSIGLAANKFLAKIASDLDKPRGFAVIGSTEATAFLRAQPVGMIHGVGKATQSRMARDGITRIGQLANLPGAELNRRFGSFGQRLAHYARGIDHRQVKTRRPVKSVSSETTFEDPIADAAELAGRLSRLVERVAGRMQENGYLGSTVTLKLKTASFKTLTRSHTLHEATGSSSLIETTAQSLLAREADGTPYRLIGVGMANMINSDSVDQSDLLADMQV